MADYNEFLEALKDGAKELAKETFDGFEDQAISDTEAFARKCEADIKRRTAQLANGDLTEEDFQDLMEGKKALAEIHALTQAGIARVKLENFRVGPINLIVKTATDVLL